MIEISLGTAALLYGLVIAAGVALTWLLTEYSAGRTYTALEQQDLWRCDFCTFTYLDRTGTTMSRCPRCNSFNLVPGSEAPPEQEVLAEGEAPRRNPSRRKRPGAGRRGPRRRR